MNAASPNSPKQATKIASSENTPSIFAGELFVEIDPIYDFVHEVIFKGCVRDKAFSTAFRERKDTVCAVFSGRMRKARK